MALLLLIASTAGAAGLGRLVVLSALGEPFRAEIDLLSSADEHAGLTPRLASPEFYPLLGFRYNPALAGASLHIRTRPHGRHVIEVLSARPLNEPFIHLLVELESNAARIVRGYTVLLDPHGYRSLREIAAAEFLPAVFPPAVSAAPRVTVADNRRTAGRQARMREEQLNAKTLAGMLERVAALEAAVGQLQGRLAILNSIEPVQKPSVAEAPPARDPDAVKAATVAATAAPASVQDMPAVAAPSPLATDASTPGRAQVKDSLLNEALLVLVVGLLIILAWLAWVVWGPPSRERAPKGKG